MKRFAHIVSFLFIAVQMNAQGGDLGIVRKTGQERDFYKNEWHFCISLMTSYTGFVRYGVLKIHEDNRREVTWLSRDSFLEQAAGHNPSKANPNKTNFWELNQLDIGTLDLLWKIRYAEYPYDDPKKMETGWAGKMFTPSDAQWAFLKQKYSFAVMSDLIYGENLWNLLRDVQDQQWQAQYSSMK